MKKAFTIQLVRDGSMCFIPVPFDPKAVFGKVRAPVRVTLNGFTFRSTIASMGEGPCIPLKRDNREGAGLEGNEELHVVLELDEEERVATPPADLVKALKAAPPAWERFREASFTHQREAVEAVTGAKATATRERRIAALVTKYRAAAAKPATRTSRKSA